MAASSRGIRRPKVAETSAGGFVLSAKDSQQVALIGRYTKNGRLEWCLPKGHPENEESIEQAAIREVAEETGLEVEIIEPLGAVTYEFSVPSKVIQKTVHHFLMRQTGGFLTVEKDPDHEAAKVDWFNIHELEAQLAHENERRLARKVVEWVNQQ